MAKGPDSSSDQEAPVVEVSHSPNVANGKAIAKLKTGYGEDPAADKSSKVQQWYPHGRRANRFLGTK